MSIIELKVPDIGGSTNVNIAEVYVKAGDKIVKDDNIMMLETDKATMDVPAEQSGVIKNVIIKAGDKVSEGDLILMLDVEDSASSSNIPSLGLAEIKVESPEQVNAQSFAKAHASPSIRKLARELGANLGKIVGSGNKGRITEDDVKSYIKGVMTGQATAVSGGAAIGLDLLPWPNVDFAKFGEVEVKELSRIKKISGSNLARNWIMIPHVTQFDEAYITELESFRKQLNEEHKKIDVKVTPLAFLIKACVYALKQFPEFNASLDGDKLVYKKYYNIGFAADTPHGLVVPVLKDADKKGVVTIAKETSELARLARDGKLKPNDMQGGTFTISSLGGIGGTAFTPIINAPEVAILGVSKSAVKPVWDGKVFQPRLVLPLSLSYDHRIIDGALAAKFTSYLSKMLTDIRHLVL